MQVGMQRKKYGERKEERMRQKIVIYIKCCAQKWKNPRQLDTGCANMRFIFQTL